ncbi:MAG: TonB-dependent receptor [Kordiimonadaceae bacterium]|nr:TonB-dependent receptor [Kordiimonadaceae bacterium]MBO6567323.1 TonB-dependent receptor [Kordiimonadaceae bacterium]MBO6963463.1 TonB-dependent receptor [Kordiimonadaceae bacterium]
MIHKKRLLASAAMSLVLAVPSVSMAVTAQDAAADDESFAIDEIIITARKREQSLQDTPIAISTFNTQQLFDAGFNNIVDVARATPGLFIEGYNDRNARIATSPRFRGITVDNSDPLLRTASVFIDGVYVTGGIQGIGVQELERVEIIKGPQSALFGRNTFAGAINYITKDPGEEFKINMMGLAATRDEYRGQIGIEGGITDNVNGRLNVSYDHVGGHYRNNNDRSQELGEETTWSVSGTLVLKPTENFRVKARALYYEDSDGPAAVARVGGFAEHNFGGFPLEGGGTTERAFQGTLRIPGDDEVAANTTRTDFDLAMAALARLGEATSLGLTFDDLDGFGLEREAFRGSIASTYDFDNGMALDVLFGYNKEEYLFFGDFDSTGTYGFNTSGASDIEDISIEARLSGTAFDDKLTWTIGGNYLDIDILTAGGFYDGILDFWFSGVIAPANSTGAKTAGLFGILDYQINEQLQIIFEGRYQDDEIRNAAVNNGVGNFDKFLPRVVLNWTPNDDTTVYLNYSVGNLPGGFNAEVAELDAEQLRQLELDNPGIDQTFNEEKLENYEIGLKQYFDERRAAMNVAAFYMKRSDQIFSGFAFIDETDPNAPNPVRTVAFTGNGATTDIYGVEVDLTYNLSQALTFQGSVSYIDATIDSFPEGAGSGDFGDVFGPDASVEGQRAPRFPKWAWNANLTYEKPINGTFLGIEDPTYFWRADSFYSGSFFDSNTNLARTQTALDINFRTGLRMDNLSVELFVTNLFNEDAPPSANNIADTSADVRFGSGFFDFSQESIHVALRRKRQVGIRFNYNF